VCVPRFGESVVVCVCLCLFSDIGMFATSMSRGRPEVCLDRALLSVNMCFLSAEASS